MPLNIALGLLVAVPVVSLFSWRSWQKKSERRKLIILQWINSRDKAFGLEIGDACGMGPATLYPLLRDMEHADLLAAELSETMIRVRGGRPRKYYSITNKGKAYIESRV